MIVFDTSLLALAFDPATNAPTDPQTGKPVTKCKERIDFLLSSLSTAKERVLIPTPVLAEYLVKGGADRDKRLSEFLSSKVFAVAPFDIRAAIECAEIEDGDMRNKVLTENQTKAKVKFDRQIIAIAKAMKANAVYTGDVDLAKCAKRNDIIAVMTWELPLPPEPPSKLESPQMNLAYEEAGTFGAAEVEDE